MMGIQIDAGSIVASVALLIAIWSAVKADRFNKRQTAFEETNERLNLLLIEREAAESQTQRRADLSANFYQASKNNYRLKVFNRGQGVATNVRLEVMDDSDLLLQDDIERKFPIPSLEQHGSVELLAAVCMGSPARAHLKIIWDDAIGEAHEKELHPSW